MSLTVKITNNPSISIPITISVFEYSNSCIIKTIGILYFFKYVNTCWLWSGGQPLTLWLFLLQQSDLRHHHRGDGGAGRVQRRDDQQEAAHTDRPRRPAGLRRWTAPLRALPLPRHRLRSVQHRRHLRESLTALLWRIQVWEDTNNKAVSCLSSQIFIFLGETFLSMNWAIVADILLVRAWALSQNVPLWVLNIRGMGLEGFEFVFEKVWEPCV